ncbi:DUF1692-domain-containing protein [Ascodesmis nigricans]|uniref:Endoplasmic reticulum-Golgi intermediate compartment protein n=1 Tax=Ascodesmis nigricans TaxID=341454 RepID=A0A4S2N6Y1_9PEZI|nr:DUF1692-domain-containing protein [Ascodesmis nigricans]
MPSFEESHFAPAKGGLSTFDAFPKTRSTYRVTSSRGGFLTVTLIAFSLALVWSEFLSHLSGNESQLFRVEKGVGHTMQINIDITIAMPCGSLHINAQDDAMDRVLAGQVLTKEDTSFDDTSAHRLVDIKGREDHVYEVLSKARKSKFGKTKLKPMSFLRGETKGSCRIYGSMDVNRVQGNFHITAAGHGYYHGGAHIDHNSFNFSHVVNELSFGEYYPKLVNPLDGVITTTDENFYKFQYFLSIVPTQYTSFVSGRSLLTNQYSVTESSRSVSEFKIPGIFFKYDIEPLSLTVEERRTPLYKFLIRVVNIFGGVMVGGNWMYKLVLVIGEYFKKRGARSLAGRGLVFDKEHS